MAKYNQELKEWIVANAPRKPLYSISDKLSIHGQKIEIVAIKTCHSVSGPIGCLLKKDEELPDSYFNFLGYILYFDRQIDWFVGDKINSILDARINDEVLNTPLKESEKNMMEMLDRVFPNLPD